MRTVTIIMFLFVLHLNAKAQDLQAIKNIIVTQEATQLSITYDIEDNSSKNLYEINIKLFDSSSFALKIPTVATGDIGKNILPGKGKKIIIPYTENGITKDQRFGVLFYNISKHTINDKNAVVRSILIPGWGDRYVFKNGKTTGTAFMIASYGCIGYGVYNKFLAESSYKNYQNAFEQNDINKHYDATTSKNNQFILFTSIGVGIWAWDVARVAIKSNKNKKLISGSAKRECPRLNYCIFPPLNKMQPEVFHISYKF
jgi:hypothetical protein